VYTILLEYTGYESIQLWRYEMTKFEVGKTYVTRSIGDHDCRWSFKVVSRTEKMITVSGDGETKRIKVGNYDGVETAYPLGRYSMAPSIRADRIAA
jgi:hypothetical protein